MLFERLSMPGHRSELCICNLKDRWSLGKLINHTNLCSYQYFCLLCFSIFPSQVFPLIGVHRTKWHSLQMQHKSLMCQNRVFSAGKIYRWRFYLDVTFNTETSDPESIWKIQSLWSLCGQKLLSPSYSFDFNHHLALIPLFQLYNIGVRRSLIGREGVVRRTTNRLTPLFLPSVAVSGMTVIQDNRYQPSAVLKAPHRFKTTNSLLQHKATMV